MSPGLNLVLFIGINMMGSIFYWGPSKNITYCCKTEISVYPPHWMRNKNRILVPLSVLGILQKADIILFIMLTLTFLKLQWGMKYLYCICWRETSSSFCKVALWDWLGKCKILESGVQLEACLKQTKTFWSSKAWSLSSCTGSDHKWFFEWSNEEQFATLCRNFK